jgi:hypothetical protein
MIKRNLIHSIRIACCKFGCLHSLLFVPASSISNGFYSPYENRVNHDTYSFIDRPTSDLAGEAVILDLRSGVYYGLNEVGARIWHLVQHPQTLQSIQHTILEEYDVDSEACTQDISHLLQDLQAAGLVEMGHHEASA